MPRHLFTDLGAQLIEYKNASNIASEAMLLDAISLIKHMPEKITGKEEAIQAYTDLVYSATLIRYAQILSNMRSQRPFEILFDFATMKFEGEFAPLADVFSIDPDRSEMTLKCPLYEIKLETWNLFRKAQVAHLDGLDKNAVDELTESTTHAAQKSGKDDAGVQEAVQKAVAGLKRKMDTFNFTKLDLSAPDLKLPKDVLDPAHPPLDQLFPIQIQMGGKLFNEAVDRTSISASGKFRLTRRSDGKFQLPGGGMVEILSDPNKVDAYLKKMLDEHLAEEHANLHSKAAEYFDGIKDSAQFNQVFDAVFASAQANALPDGVLAGLKLAVASKDQNSDKVKAAVQILDLHIVAKKEHLEKIKLEMQNMATLMGEGSKDAKPQLGALQTQLTEKLESKSQTLGVLKNLAELRAMVQLKPFELTELYAGALAYVKQNAVEVLIQEYCDSRLLGGSNTTHSFMMTGKPLENWFKEKFKGVDCEMGDDIAGSSIVRMSLLGALGQFENARFSHLLNLLAHQVEVMSNDSLVWNKTWDDAEYTKARSHLQEAAKNLFVLNASQFKGKEIWQAADDSLNKAMQNLTHSKREKIHTAVDELKAKITNKASDADEIKKAYAEFKNKCTKILDKRDSVALNAILTTLAIVVTIVLVALIGFGIGFVAGLWTGPGAFFAAVATGSAAACSILGATGGVAILTGALVGHGLFKQKNTALAEKNAVGRFMEDAEYIVPVLPDEGSLPPPAF